MATATPSSGEGGDEEKALEDESVVHCLNVNVMLSNMTFLMIFAVFDPSPLTLWINCSF